MKIDVTIRDGGFCDPIEASAVPAVGDIVEFGHRYGSAELVVEEVRWLVEDGHRSASPLIIVRHRDQEPK